MQEFEWDEQIRATILSSFFWGYIVSQIPCGSLITYFGSKYLLLTGCASNAILTLITPWCTHWGGSTALLTIRILQGVFQGALYPSCHSLIANWAPLSERSRLSVLVYPGAQIGTVVTLSTGGLIASSSLGWPGIFYIWGTGGLVWCIVWWFYGANGPSEHKTISVEERDYILQSRDAHTEKLPTPWRNIFRSPAFYALTITHACCSYSFWTITTVTPTYMKGVFGLDIQKNALLSAIPPIAMFVLSHIFGMLVRLCMDRLKLPLRFIRILFNTVGSEIPAAALIGLGFVTGNHPALAIFLLTVAYGVSSAIYFGYYVNHMDLCPTHAGILMAVTNSVATGSGIFSTLAVGWFVKDEVCEALASLVDQVRLILLISDKPTTLADNIQYRSRTFYAWNICVCLLWPIRKSKLGDDKKRVKHTKENPRLR